MAKTTCRHTEAGHNFFTRDVTYYEQHHSAKGVPVGTAQSNRNKGRVAYCSNCRRRIGRVRYTENGTELLPY